MSGIRWLHEFLIVHVFKESHFLLLFKQLYHLLLLRLRECLGRRRLWLVFILWSIDLLLLLLFILLAFHQKLLLYFNWVWQFSHLISGITSTDSNTMIFGHLPHMVIVNTCLKAWLWLKTALLAWYQWWQRPLKIYNPLTLLFINSIICLNNSFFLRPQRWLLSKWTLWEACGWLMKWISFIRWNCCLIHVILQHLIIFCELPFRPIFNPFIKKFNRLWTSTNSRW